MASSPLPTRCPRKSIGLKLDERGIWWVGRAKDNMQHNVVRVLETTEKNASCAMRLLL